MSSIEKRIRELIDEHLDLGRDPNFDLPFGQGGVSSLDCVHFVTLVAKEFGVAVHPEEWMRIGTLRGLVERIETA